MLYKYEVKPLASRKIWTFYRNVAKKYRHTFDAEDIVKNAQMAIKLVVLYRVANVRLQSDVTYIR